MDKVIIRDATIMDADGISSVLQDLVAAGKRSKTSDADFALTHYIAHPDQMCCNLALDAQGQVLGFQSLKHAIEGNPYGAPEGWGVIGTHIRPFAARRGVGRALFHTTLRVVQASGIPAIDATISSRNEEGLAYYNAMGFVDYRQDTDTVSKRYKVS